MLRPRRWARQPGAPSCPGAGAERRAHHRAVGAIPGVGWGWLGAWRSAEPWHFNAGTWDAEGRSLHLLFCSGRGRRPSGRAAASGDRARPRELVAFRGDSVTMLLQSHGKYVGRQADFSPPGCAASCWSWGWSALTWLVGPRRLRLHRRNLPERHPGF